VTVEDDSDPPYVDEDGDPTPLPSRQPQAATEETAPALSAPARLRRWTVAAAWTAFGIGATGLWLYCAWWLTGRVAVFLGLPRFLGIPLAIVALLGVSIVGRVTWDKRIRQRSVRSTLAAYLPHGHCGACGHSLAGLAPAADGCTTCVECGASWRLDFWKDDFPDHREPKNCRPLDRGRTSGAQTLPDARGYPVRLLCTRTVAELAPELRQHRERLLRTRLPGDGTRLFVCAPVLVAIGVAGAAGALEIILIPLLIVEMIIAIGAVASRWPAARRAALREMAREVIDSGRCARCSGALSARPALADGARVCPTCGAAWMPGAPIHRARGPA
jgi:hypothetical protein